MVELLTPLYLRLCMKFESDALALTFAEAFYPSSLQTVQTEFVDGNVYVDDVAGGFVDGNIYI